MLALLPAASAGAQTSAQEKAYTLTITCSVVAAYYKNPDDISRTADALRKMGAAMGYDNSRTTQDTLDMASAFGVELKNDPGAMERHRAACQKIGLVG